MPLRDYFAAKAMQGSLAMGPSVGGEVFKTYEHAQALAENSYHIADAMIKERG